MIDFQLSFKYTSDIGFKQLVFHFETFSQTIFCVESKSNSIYHEMYAKCFIALLLNFTSPYLTGKRNDHEIVKS